MRRVHRVDYASGAIQRSRLAPNGVGLILDAYPTRTGVLTYRGVDGSVRRELRHPDQVFDPKSLETLKQAVVTDRHPDGPVDPSTFRDVVRGHVLDDVAPADDRPGHVRASVLIADGELLSLIDAGERSELSCGYQCDLDETPGEYEGEPYDASQKGISYNHLAVLAPGEGRAGPSAALRLDGACFSLSSGAERIDREDRTDSYAKSHSRMLDRIRAMSSARADGDDDDEHAEREDRIELPRQRSYQDSVDGMRRRLGLP